MIGALWEDCGWGAGDAGMGGAVYGGRVGEGVRGHVRHGGSTG